MTDFAKLRRMMVEGQVRTSDVLDPRLLAAMLDIPREKFVPAGKTGLAYLDLDIPVAEASADHGARRLLKPMVLAKLVQALRLEQTERVLDVGCATGYSSALLSRLAGSVVAVEEDPGLVGHALGALAALGVANVEVVRGKLAEGHAKGAPYDAILLNGAVELLPPVLARQLRDGGRLACIQGKGPATKAMLYRSDQGEISSRPVFDAAAPLLPGFVEPPAFVF